MLRVGMQSSLALSASLMHITTAHLTLLNGVANSASGVDRSVLLAHCILEALSTESA